MSTEDAPGPGNAHDWLDQEAGPLVRSYALTGGRAGPGAETFDLLTYVVTMSGAAPQLSAALQPEHHAILRARAQTRFGGRDRVAHFASAGGGQGPPERP